LAMGITLNSVLISPIASYLQGRLTHRIMMNIYDDLMNSSLGYLMFYETSKCHLRVLLNDTFTHRGNS
jgi:hypothetical protein